MSASGGLFSLLANPVGGTAAPHPMLLLFPASVLLFPRVTSCFLSVCLSLVQSLALFLEISVVECVGTVTLHVRSVQRSVEGVLRAVSFTGM